MRSIILELRQALPGELFSFEDALSVVSNDSRSRHAVRCALSRLAGDGSIIRCRKGLYAFGQAFRKRPVDVLTLACRMKRPSYVTMESALQFHGLISEAVRTVQSATATRGGRFDTPFGAVQYHVLTKFDYEGVEALSGNSGEILMATPAKAVEDLAAVTGRRWPGPSAMKEDLRIEFESGAAEKAFLRKIGVRNFNVWAIDQ